MDTVPVILGGPEKLINLYWDFIKLDQPAIGF
jgi:hypothetical protein